MRLGGVVLATILAIGACSSEPTPKEPPRSPTPTATTPADAAPTPPAQASEDSPEGAAAFVNHYIDVFNYAARTGDVEGLSEISSPDCTGCQRYIKLYRDTYAAGGYFKGKDWDLSNLRTESENTTWLIRSSVDAPAGTLRSDEDSEEQPGQAVKSTIGFRLQKSLPFRVSELGLAGERE